MASAKPSVRSYVGVALVTPTELSPTPTDYIPVNKEAIKATDIIDPLIDTGLRGSMVETYGYIQGRRHTEIEVGGLAYKDTVGWWIGSVLGVDTVTADVTPGIYNHAVTLKNATTGDAQPTALCITDYYVAGTRQYTGAKVTDFTLNFNADGQLEYTAKLMAEPSTVPLATLTPSFSSVTATPVWQGTVSIRGVAIAYTQSGSITMSRKSEAIYGIGNQQGPYEIFVAALETTGSFTFVMEDDAQLENFLNNNQPSLTLSWYQGNPTEGLTGISFTLNQGAYQTAVIDRSGDHVTIQVDVLAISNVQNAGPTAGYAPISWSIQNSVADSYTSIGS